MGCEASGAERSGACGKSTSAQRATASVREIKLIMARKEKKAGPPTTSLVYVGMACFFIVGAGAGYLWHKSQIHTLGQQLRGYEVQVEAAKRRRLMLERTYAAMCSPADLD